MVIKFLVSKSLTSLQNQYLGENVLSAVPFCNWLSLLLLFLHFYIPAIQDSLISCRGGSGWKF